MEPKKGDATIYPIAEEDEGAGALPVESNENPSQPENEQWLLTPLGADILERIHAGGTSSRRGGRVFIARRPFRHRQYTNDRKQGQRKSDEHGGADTSSDEAAGSKPPTAEQAAEGEQSHSKSWSSPAGYSAYFNTVQESSAPTPCKEQQSSGSANSDDNVQESYTQKKQFNRAPGSLPYARGNGKMKNISFQHRRYWVQGPDLSISNTCGEYAWNQTRRYGRAAYHNTARSGQRGDQKRVFSASGRNYCRGAGNCTRGGANYLREPGNWLSDRGDFYRIGNGCRRGAGNCTRGGANYLRDPGNWLSDRGDFYRIGNGCRRGAGNCTRGSGNYLRDPANWLNGTGDFSRRRNCCPRGASNGTRGGGNYLRDPGNWLNGTGDFCRRRNSYPRGGRRPSSRRGGQTRTETSYPRTGDFNRRPTVDDREPSPALQTNEETSPTTTIELGISTFTTPHESSLVISDPSDIVIQRVTISDNNPCDYVSIEVRAQLPSEEQQAPLWTLAVPQYIRPLCLCPQLWAADAMGYAWQRDDRPVMPVMVPQNPPIGTPVYYQQPVMGPAWSPYVPLVEAYNEMPCYPADYGNPGYYPPSYANPVYQNNPMEYMPPNPAGDPAAAPAVPPQSDNQQTGEAPSRPAGCSQCGGCGSCCTCNRPRTSPPLPNHEPRTAAGPINFGAQKSVKDDGSDLPNDIPTLRFFYNLGVEAHRSASRGVPNGDAEADQAEEDEKKEITNLVGRLHKVLFRQNPEPQARFPLNQRNADQPRLPPIYYVNPGKFPWSQNQKDGNMGRGIDSMRGTGRLRARRDSEDYSGGMSARPGDTNEQNSNRRK